MCDGFNGTGGNEKEVRMTAGSIQRIGAGKKYQLPDPSRYYKRRAFSLGFPDEKRDKIYFRPQYPPHPNEIKEYH